MLRTIGTGLLMMCALGAASPAMAAGASGQSAIARIDVERSGGNLVVSGGALALSDGDFSAMLSVDKHGKSGTISSKQGGKLSLKAGESGSVARIGLSYQPGDRIEVTLDVTVGGRSVSEARTILK